MPEEKDDPDLRIPAGREPLRGSGVCDLSDEEPVAPEKDEKTPTQNEEGVSVRPAPVQNLANFSCGQRRFEDEEDGDIPTIGSR